MSTYKKRRRPAGPRPTLAGKENICEYCRKTIKVDDWQIIKFKSNKPIHYHAKCWTRQKNAGKRYRWNASNPLGGFR